MGVEIKRPDVLKECIEAVSSWYKNGKHLQVVGCKSWFARANSWSTRSNFPVSQLIKVWNPFAEIRASFVNNIDLTRYWFRQSLPKLHAKVENQIFGRAWVSTITCLLSKCYVSGWTAIPESFQNLPILPGWASTVTVLETDWEIALKNFSSPSSVTQHAAAFWMSVAVIGCFKRVQTESFNSFPWSRYWNWSDDNGLILEEALKSC